MKQTFDNGMLTLPAKPRMLLYMFAVTAVCTLLGLLYNKTSMPINEMLEQRKPAERSNHQVVKKRLNNSEPVKGQDQLNHLRRNSFPNELKSVDIDKLSKAQVALTLHSYLDNSDTLCWRKIRMGNLDDGGWEICDDPDVRPVPPCSIYSFGIAGDWSFDDDVSRVYGCHVFAFDPSIGQKQHDRTPLIHFYPWGVDGATRTNAKKWPMLTLKDIKDKLGHTNKTIDVVKMDIESSEWVALPQMLSSGALEGVKQLLVEYHVTSSSTNHANLKTIQAIERYGLKKFNVHKNFHCARKENGFPTMRTSCYEIMYKRTDLGHVQSFGGSFV